MTEDHEEPNPMAYLHIAAQGQGGKTPKGATGVSGLNATQIARLNLEAQQRAAKALEDIRDIVRAAAESLAPIVVQLGEGMGPILVEATADMRRLAGAMLASLEYSPLDTHED